MSMNTLLPDGEHLIARRYGNELQLLNSFSGGKNILLRFIEGNMIAAFLDCSKGIDSFDEAEVFHYGWDDLAPWSFGSYEMIGANHGSRFAFRVHTLRHWCFPEDIGKVFTDEAGNEFVLVAVESLSDLIFHSHAVMQNGKIEFVRNMAGRLTSEDKRVIPVQAVTRIQLPNFDHSTLTIHNRYNSIEIFTDEGRQVDGESVRCRSVRMVVDMDLCPPDALCEYLISHPGRYVAPNAPELESLLHMRLTYTFQADNTMRADAEIEFLRDIDQPVLYGLLQYYGEKFFAVHEKFVPKIKPFELTDFYTYHQTVDLGKIWRVPQNNTVSKTFLPEDCCDKSDMPCRYIDFFGTEKSRQLGVVLGYSRLRGMSAADAPVRGGINLVLATSGKIYPYVLSVPKVSRGEQFVISAYRQFFQPSGQFNGAMFGHYENGDYCFYADCADGGTYTLELPEKFAGKSFEIIEQYGHVTLPSENVLDSRGAVEIIFADRSGLVIKVNDQGK